MDIKTKTLLFTQKENKIFVASHAFKNRLTSKFSTNKSASSYVDGNFIAVEFKANESNDQYIYDLKHVLSETVSSINPYNIKIVSLNEFPLNESKKTNLDSNKENIKNAYEEKTKKTFCPTTIALCNSVITITDKNSDFFENEKNKKYLITILDLFLGLSLIVLNDDPFTATCRQMSSQSGDYISMSKGIQYFIPGNNWFLNPNRTKIMIDLIKYSIEFVSRNEHSRFWDIDNDICYGYDLKKIRSTIDNFDKKEAKRFYSFTANFIPNYIIRQITNEQNEKKNDFIYNWLC
jgi:hypothetical protein